MAQGVLVHEWLAATGGSENVFDALVETFPEADLLCLWNDVEGRYPGRDLTETWLARSPLRRSKAAALPFLPTTWRNRPGHYDWALVSTHLFAHPVSFRGQGDAFRKYVYVHSPARYIWEPELDRRGSSSVARVAAAALKPLDRRRAQEITAAAANSQFVRERIARTWEIDSTVIYPPVDVERIRAVDDWSTQLTPDEVSTLDALPDEFVLGASRLIPYKALDLVIKAGAAAAVPVVIAGDGPERQRLAAAAEEAGVPTSFLGRVSDAMLYSLYQRCLVYVFPAVEDFGIMPVEAMAAGAAVVCGRTGGVLETVDGSAGRHVDFDDDRELAAAVREASALRGAGPRAAVERFDRARFVDEIRDFVGAKS